MGRIDLGSGGLGKWNDFRLLLVEKDTSAPVFLSVGSYTLMWVIGSFILKFPIPMMNESKFQ